MKITHMMSQEDHRRLHEAMTATEKRTSAHFALIVTPVSDRYLLFPAMWAAVVAFIVGGVLAMFWHHLSFRIGFLMESGTFVALALIFDWLPLRLLLVPAQVKREHCVSLARREFAARILADDQHRPGMLFFASLGERHVEILADAALHRCVGEDAWRRIVESFVAAPKAGQSIVDGLQSSVEACAALLELHYPRTTSAPP